MKTKQDFIDAEVQKYTQLKNEKEQELEEIDQNISNVMNISDEDYQKICDEENKFLFELNYALSIANVTLEELNDIDEDVLSRLSKILPQHRHLIFKFLEIDYKGAPLM